MSKYQEYLQEANKRKMKVQFRQEFANGDIEDKTWPDPNEWEIVNKGVGGDKFGNEASISYQHQESGYIVDVDARNIESGGSKGKWEFYGSGITKTGTFKKFEDITGLLKTTLPSLAKKIWATIDKQIPKKIGNFERSVLPYDMDVSYTNNKDNMYIVFEDIEEVVQGGSSPYILDNDDVETQGEWDSFHNMISIVKKLKA